MHAWLLTCLAYLLPAILLHCAEVRNWPAARRSRGGTKDRQERVALAQARTDGAAAVGAAAAAGSEGGRPQPHWLLLPDESLLTLGGELAVAAAAAFLVAEAALGLLAAAA